MLCLLLYREQETKLHDLKTEKDALIAKIQAQEAAWNNLIAKKNGTEKERADYAERVRVLTKERDTQYEVAKSLQGEKATLSVEVKHLEGLVADLQRERDAYSQQATELEQAITSLQRVYGLDQGSVQDLYQAADSLKQERNNMADTIQYWKKMVTALQTDKEAIAEKLREQVDMQQRDRETYKREKQQGDNKLKDLARVIDELTNDKELTQRELLREREKTTRKERDSAAIFDKGTHPNSL